MPTLCRSRLTLQCPGLEAPGHSVLPAHELTDAHNALVGNRIINLVALTAFANKASAVERGQVLCKPGSVKPHTHFTAEIYVLSKDEGGRHTPFFNNYRPQFYFRTTDVTGAVELPKDKEMVMPGDNVSITVKLIAPIAMEEGLRFAIREGGRTVGAGVVAKIIE